MFHEITALTACCDRCRAVAEGGYLYVDRPAARESLRCAGWDVLDDDQLRCPDCGCEISGHNWSPWYRCGCAYEECRCQADLPGTAYRVCHRCAVTDKRPSTENTGRTA